MRRQSGDKEQLALAAKEGDKEARNNLYFQYERLIKVRCRRARRVADSFLGGSGPITGEDVDQQLFLLFCNLLDTWQPGKLSFEEHLLKNVGGAARHYVRRCLGYRNRCRVVRFTQNGEGVQVEPESEGAASQMDHAEERVVWQGQAEGLDERWKRLIEMKFHDELTTGEISVIDGHSRRTINRHLREAMDAVRAKIEEEWEDCG
jgi:RNA polymerase sigma factor (sigma-70 family)